MSRLDWKRGRFSSDFEVNEIEGALRGFQDGFGDACDYYRFDHESSVMDDIYDEGDGVGRVFNGPIPLPCLSITHVEGGNQDTDTGFYFNDSLHVTLGFQEFSRTGMTRADITHEKYIRDRIVYDDKVFRVSQLQILGQVQRRDVIVSFEATQVKPDELVDDLQFAKWSA